jgi:beta-galactosidase
MDLAGFPKSQYYLRKSLWTDEPMVYLSTAGPGRRRFQGRSTTRSIYCYTNCDSVELFHDGKSLGSKPLPTERVITWPPEFTSGVLKAVGTKGGRQVTYELKKAGAAAKLVLHPDVQKLAADGRDVAQIEVNVTDKDGTRLPDNANVVSCDITGPARIIGIENGNTFSPERYDRRWRTAYQGRLIIYVQSLKTPGDAKLTVACTGLEGATSTLKVR